MRFFHRNVSEADRRDRQTGEADEEEDDRLELGRFFRNAIFLT